MYVEVFRLSEFSYCARCGEVFMQFQTRFAEYADVLFAVQRRVK